MTPFSIVILDDEDPTALVQVLLYGLRQRPQDNVDVRIWWVRNASPKYQAAVPCRWDVEADTFTEVEKKSWEPRLLLRGDVAIVDLKIPCSGESTWQSHGWRPVDPTEGTADVLDIAESYGGARFLLNMEQALDFQAIVIRSQWADEDDVQETLGRWVDDRPHVQLFDKSADAQTGRVVTGLLEDVGRGFARLKDTDAISFAAVHDDPVLILGESGTGKEGIARAIHARWVDRRYGGRAKPELAVLNCPALSPELARAELFGYVRGAFTGADQNYGGLVLGTAKVDIRSRTNNDQGVKAFRAHLLKACESGILAPLPEGSKHDFQYTGPRPITTLFLDEVGDLPLNVQTLLLRFFESGDVTPLGYPGRITDIRFRTVAATSDQFVAGLAGVRLGGVAREETMLRRDLVFRLRGQVIRAAPLTQESAQADVPLLLGRTASREWSKDAVSTFTAEIARRAADSADAFGQFREVNRLIRMIEAFSRSAAERGLRRRSIVEKADVAAVLTAADVSALSVGELEVVRLASEISDYGARLAQRSAAKHKVWGALLAIGAGRLCDPPAPRVVITREEILEAAGYQGVDPTQRKSLENNLNSSGLKPLSAELEREGIRVRVRADARSVVVEV